MSYANALKPTISENNVQVYENPLFTKRSERRSVRKSGKQHRLSYLNKAIGVRCQTSTTAFAMTMVTAATFAVLALLGAFQPSTLRNNPLGIISIAIAGSLGNLQLLNMYEESRSVKKSRASLYPFLVLTPAFFLVLIIAVIPNRGMKGPSVQNTTVAGLNIMNCTIATRNIEWSSVCMKTIGKKGALFTQVSQGVLFGSMKRLEAIVLGDALYATVSVLMKTVYGTDDPKSNKCFDFIIRASCGAIFST